MAAGLAQVNAHAHAHAVPNWSARLAPCRPHCPSRCGGHSLKLRKEHGTHVGHSQARPSPRPTSSHATPAHHRWTLTTRCPTRGRTRCRQSWWSCRPAQRRLKVNCRANGRVGCGARATGRPYAPALQTSPYHREPTCVGAAASANYSRDLKHPGVHGRNRVSRKESRPKIGLKTSRNSNCAVSHPPLRLTHPASSCGNTPVSRGTAGRRRQ